MRFLPQAEITLNLMRASRTNPTKLAYKAVFSPFKHNKTPLAPPGCKALIHKKPSQCRLWDPHRVKGWYLGPALGHYCCHCCYVNTTQAECNSDTVDFFSNTGQTPTITTTDEAIMAAEALIKVLNNPNDFNNAEALHDTASNTLTKLSKVYVMMKDPASPRVAEPPRVAPVPRVAEKPTATSVEPI
jgi:hypothetical protein